MSDTSGTISLVKYALRDGPKIKCPNCARELKGFNGQCPKCGTAFKDNRRTMGTADKVYSKPRFKTMSQDTIAEFCDSADTAWHTKNYEICYAKRGKAIRIHIAPFDALKRCVKIIMAPFTGAT